MFPWLANPLLFSAWFTYRAKPKTTIAQTIVTLLFMLSFLFVKNVMTDTSGRLNPITGYGPAYFLWLISSALILIESLQKYKSDH